MSAWTGCIKGLERGRLADAGVSALFRALPLSEEGVLSPPEDGARNEGAGERLLSVQGGRWLGHAPAPPWRSDRWHRPHLRTVQRRVQGAGRGLWSPDCGCAPFPQCSPFSGSHSPRAAPGLETDAKVKEGGQVDVAKVGATSGSRSTQDTSQKRRSGRLRRRRARGLNTGAARAKQLEWEEGAGLRWDWEEEVSSPGTGRVSPRVELEGRSERGFGGLGLSLPRLLAGWDKIPDFLAPSLGSSCSHTLA